MAMPFWSSESIEHTPYETSPLQLPTQVACREALRDWLDLGGVWLTALSRPITSCPPLRNNCSPFHPHHPPSTTRHLAFFIVHWRSLILSFSLHAVCFCLCSQSQSQCVTDLAVRAAAAALPLESQPQPHSRLRRCKPVEQQRDSSNARRSSSLSHLDMQVPASTTSPTTSTSTSATSTAAAAAAGPHACTSMWLAHMWSDYWFVRSSSKCTWFSALEYCTRVRVLRIVYCSHSTVGNARSILYELRVQYLEKMPAGWPAAPTRRDSIPTLLSGGGGGGAALVPLLCIFSAVSVTGDVIDTSTLVLVWMQSER